ncbi:hypothetical protein MKLM6_3767 [Methylomonas koyamae]|nr:hypothetical protein MKLM6_3767 [Methylomonas koyamae]
MKNTVLQAIAIFGLVIGELSAVEASQVSFVQSNVNALPGQILTFDLVGEGFSSGPDGAGFSLAWDKTVLQYVTTTVANPPWDTSFVSDTNAGSGMVDFVFLGKSTGTAGTDFSLASFTFNVIGNVGAATELSLADAFGGFSALGGQSLSVNYLNSQVQVVPLPSAVWLFGTALLGLCNPALKRRKRRIGG